MEGGKRNFTITGMKGKGPNTDVGRRTMTQNEDNIELRQASHRLMSDGQKFWNRLMKKLFDSETSGAVRRT